MKFKLKNTTLLDETQKPLPLFHATPQNDIRFFYPLSHFGTKKAANTRAMNFACHALGLQRQSILSDLPSEHFLNQFVKLKKFPPLSTYCVYLYSRCPLRIPDLGHHSFEQYYYWFLACYKPKQKFLSPAERLESKLVGEEKTRYKQLITQFIFIDPFTQTKENLENELSCDSLNLPLPFQKISSLPPQIPSFLKKYQDILPYFILAERVSIQRLIRFLEGEGYDSFVYKNIFEDENNDSYIIFRPEQVFYQNDTTVEHTLPQKDISYILKTEKNFFNNHQTLSPAERIIPKTVFLQQKNK